MRTSTSGFPVFPKKASAPVPPSSEPLVAYEWADCMEYVSNFIVLQLRRRPRDTIVTSVDIAELQRRAFALYRYEVLLPTKISASSTTPTQAAPFDNLCSLSGYPLSPLS